MLLLHRRASAKPGQSLADAVNKVILRRCRADVPPYSTHAARRQMVVHKKLLRGVEKMQLMLRIGGRPNDVLGIREQVMLKAGL